MNVEDRLKADLEAEIENLWEQYHAQDDCANSGHPESMDAVRYQIRLRGRIEGLEYSLAMMRRFQRES